MTRVLLENATKEYGDVMAVNDLNMGIREKEFLVSERSSSVAIFLPG
jgi:ABC-type sugar transport system ATPase subunit